MKRLPGVRGLAILIVCSLATAFGQGFRPGPPSFGGPMGPGMSPGGGGERGDWGSRRPEGDRGHDRSRGSYGDRGSEDRSSRLEGFLQSMDANHDGMLHPDEVPPERRGMFQFFASRMGVDPSKPIPISRVREAVSSRSSQNSSASTGGAAPPEKSSANKSAKPAEPPLVPGFGVEQVIVAVPAFGERVASDPAVLASSASALGAVDSRIRGYAEERFRRYDRNHSGSLEKEEWGEMRGDPAAMDRNRDGRLTLEEYTLGVADYARSRVGGSSGGDRGRGPEGGFGGGPGGPGGPADNAEHSVADASESKGGKPYRYVSPKERLPEGLPSWFAQRDRNGDGQIAMAEYSTSWSDDDAREFARQDLNGDGFLTPKECLDSAAGAVGSAVSGPSPSSTNSSPTSAPAGSGSGSSPSNSTPWWMR